MKKYFAIAFFALSACNNPHPVSSDAKNFDLQKYFGAEVIRMQTKNPIIRKTVWISGGQETKATRIGDWKKEFSIFTDADINKRAWAGEFTKSVTDTTELYTTMNEKIPVKEVRIRKVSGKIKGIEIFIRNSNYLYTSTDTLSYYPDSIYQIKKMQQIRFMNSKRYQILGKF